MKAILVAVFVLVAWFIAPASFSGIEGIRAAHAVQPPTYQERRATKQQIEENQGSWWHGKKKDKGEWKQGQCREVNGKLECRKITDWNVPWEKKNREVE